MKRQNIELSNLLFLASMGALGQACDGDDNNNTSGAFNPMTTAGMTSSGNDTGGGTNPDDDDDDDDDNADGPGDGPGDGPTDGPGDAGSDGFDDGYVDIGYDDGYRTAPSEPVGPVCEQFGQKFVECYPEYAGDMVAEYCQEELDYYSMSNPQCASQLEEWYACLSALSCEALTAEEACANVDLSMCGSGE